MAATTTPTRQLVVFNLSGEEYALPIAAVQEIIRHTDPRSVASDVPWVRGVITLRGKIIPIYDLGIRLGIAGSSEDAGKIVIVEAGERQVGVMVDEVEEVLTISDEQLEGIPGSGSSLIDTVAKIGDRLVVLLDPETLFDAPVELAA